MKRILLVLSSFFCLYAVQGQVIKLSNQAEISVLTIYPGDQLVDTFGHSAFRVKDEGLGIDQVYNYGTYNFNTPNFYGKFLRGKLLYDLSSGPFHRFLRSYVRQNRTVEEQVMHLSFADKQLFFDFLQNNVKPENRSYLYDFFFDNCATKLRDVSGEILEEKMQFNYDFLDGEDFTFRDLLHQHLDDHPWGKVGIDLALGSEIDKKASPEEYQFLPKYVYKAFENATINDTLLINKTSEIYTAIVPKEKEKSPVSPFLIFSLIALLGLFITFKDYKNKRRTKWFDFSLFFVTGAVGLILLLLWFATDHAAMANNFNVFWAFPGNLVMAFVLLKKTLKPWVRRFMLLLLLLLLATFVLWILKIQVFPLALSPIMILLIVRYLFLYRHL